MFNSEWRKRCHLEVCSISDVKAFLTAHYLGKRPAIVLCCFRIMDADNAVGCIVYSAPPREIEKRYGGTTWELARLNLTDAVPKNAETWAISKSARFIFVNHRTVDFLVSYADPSAGHKGTIYRAANWTFDGMTDAGRKTPRCDYWDARTGIKYGRKGNMPLDAIVERRPRISKARFVLKIR